MAAAQLLSGCGRRAQCSQCPSSVVIMSRSGGAVLFAAVLITAISDVLFPQLKLARNVSGAVSGQERRPQLTGPWKEMGVEPGVIL